VASSSLLVVLVAGIAGALLLMPLALYLALSED
jgi:hypothetical protein